MAPFETYCQYLAFKQHFTKEKYDYFKYAGRSRASEASFQKRKDKYFFIKLARKYNDQEIRDFFLANFIASDDPSKVWIGNLARTGHDTFNEYVRKIQSLRYEFQQHCDLLTETENFRDQFLIKTPGTHPDFIKKFMRGQYSLETLTILNMILNFIPFYDERLDDPIWESISIKVKKYTPFLKIDTMIYRKILKQSKERNG